MDFIFQNWDRLIYWYSKCNNMLELLRFIIQTTFIFLFLLSLFPRWMDELSNDKRWMISTKNKGVRTITLKKYDNHSQQYVCYLFIRLPRWAITKPPFSNQKDWVVGEGFELLILLCLPCHHCKRNSFLWGLIFTCALPLHKISYNNTMALWSNLN